MDCSVLLADRPSLRPLLDRLFAPGRRLSGPQDGVVALDPSEAPGARLGDAARRRHQQSDDLVSGARAG
ncbi:hypothetical protein, partial [Halorubrum lacusprofundi]|uniref:hypothetical protein n=1 Tax=Halorubrum lacusprofundi TaxID=2247 RepID=UPI0018D35DCD